MQGYTFGGVFEARFQYVREKHGEAGLRELVDEMRRRGYTGPVSLEELKVVEKIPFDDYLILLKTYKDLHGEFAFDRMARDVPKRKGIVGFLVRWDRQPDELFKHSGQYWKAFYDFGILSGALVTENAGVIIGLNVSPDPLFCRSLTNYFMGILQSISLEGVRGKHVECVHAGGEKCAWEYVWNRC